MKSIRYSRLAQSHASLPIVTRALSSTLCTRKLYCQTQQNLPSSSIEQRLYLAASRWAKAKKKKKKKKKKKISGSKRKETKDVSATSQSTYNNVSEARESKMPGGSSVRSLMKKILKATRNEVDQVIWAGSISCLIVHHRH